ncbi:uncharacterized protein METZ01_LOCUS146729, partial [marine metagenome]
EYAGFLDEVAVWNDDLTATEVTALYNSGDILFAPNLQGYWRMNEGFGSALTDATNNSNSGTISGAIWATSSLWGDTVNYSNGSGTNTLTFDYTVSSGHQTADLDYTRTDALFLNGGTIKEASGNNAVLTLPLPGTAGSLGATKAIVVDGTAPMVKTVTSTAANGSYSISDSIAITITLDEIVTVIGTPKIKLETGTTDTTANYASGSGTTVLIFNYVVNEGDSSSDLAYHNTSALVLNTGTIRDAAGNDANLILPPPGATGSLSAGKTLVIDGVVPMITNITSNVADSTYVVGDTLGITVILSEAVHVSGNPQLTVETGITDAYASYVSGSGTTNLTFRYIVQMGQNSIDLDYASTTALDLSNGVISDSAGNNATLTLPTPGTPGSLGANKNIIINGIVPIITGVTSSVADGNYGAGNVIPINVVFSENVTVTDTPQIKLSTGGYALDLDGIDDYAFVPNHNSIQFGTGDFSVSTWFKIDATGGTRQIFCKRGGNGNYEVQVNSAGKLSAWAPLGFSGSTVLSANTWYNITLIRMHPTSYLYLNGDLEASRTCVGSQNSSSGLSIGRDSFGGERFNGNIDEFAIWNNGLSAAEALAIYNGNATIDLTGNSGDYASSSNLVLYLRMNEGTGSTVMDETGNGHNATLNYGATWVESQLGGTDVNYTSGSGTDTLTFNYTVIDGNFSSDLDYTDTTALSLNGSTIKDDGGNDAILSLPIPGLTGSLSANKNLVVDGNVPSVTNITSPNSDGTYSSGDSISITLAYSENVTVTGTPQLLLETGPVDALANYSNGSSTSILTFLYIVAAGDSSADLDYVDTTALSLNGGT